MHALLIPTIFHCRMNVSSEFKKIQEASDLVDITFSCEGKQFGAHKLVLFACSPYFKEVLKVIHVCSARMRLIYDSCVCFAYPIAMQI